MNNHLKTFYDNELQREAVKEFMIECVKELAISKAFNGESTQHIADCKHVVENTFIKLKEIYGEKPKSSISSSR